MAANDFRNLSRIVSLLVLVVLFGLFWFLYQQLALLKSRQALKDAETGTGASVRASRTVSRSPETPEERYLYRYLGSRPEVLTQQDVTGDGNPEILAAVRVRDPELPSGDYFYSRAVVLSPSKGEPRILFDTEKDRWNGRAGAPGSPLMKIGAVGTREILIVPVDSRGLETALKAKFIWDAATSSYKKQLLGAQAEATPVPAEARKSP
jgi:hypothetical protein